MPDPARERRFRTLYGATRTPVTAYALRRAHSPEDAADVVAETFAVAWRRLDVIPPGDAGLFWLYATCRRVLANQRRGNRRRSELTERVGAHLRAAIVAEPQGSDALLARLALQRLKDVDRELLMLVSWEGLTPVQAAAVLGCAPTTVRVRLHRARARLTVEMQRVGLLEARGRAATLHGADRGGCGARGVPEGGMT